MKIYTEVIMEWNEDKGELVEVSSESYEHEGSVALCGGGGGGSSGTIGIMGQLKKLFTCQKRDSNPQPTVLETVALPIELLAYQSN